jgi:hypothetical protein
MGSTMQLTSKGTRCACAILLMLGLGSLGSVAQRTGTIPKELNGEWVLRSYYMTSNIWGISRKQAQSLIGSKLIYRDGALSACKQRVKIDKIEQNNVSAAQFWDGLHVDFSDVGIVAPSIREIRLNGNAGGNCFETYALPGEDVYLKGPDELLVDFEGVYFRATRVSVKKGTK